jgi:glycosyltransferase involved in cell wall biosynthesis
MSATKRTTRIRRQTPVLANGAPAAQILVASHAHPEFSKGGAENAAYQLFKGLVEMPGPNAWFLGCRRGGRTEPAISQPFSEREFIYSPRDFDWFKFANRDARFPREITQLFNRLSPNILHFHHYINFGIEVFLHARRALPGSKIVLTLHEFLAICNHFGQMVTTTNSHLCSHASLSRCGACFSAIEPSDFFLRREYIQRFFMLIDHFVSPSEFLAERYVAWGIPETKLSVIENLIAAPVGSRAAKGDQSDDPLRVGFFGQMSALKGLDVLIDAAEALDRADQSVIFDIFGDYSGQPESFQKALMPRLAQIGSNIRYHGPYDHQDVDKLMQSVDVVVMPSIWWENSPLVIQEAFRNRKPVICSDIGGMAEKVRDGIDGFHFRVGSAQGLSALLRRLGRNRKIIDDMVPGLRVPLRPESILDQHMKLYDRLLS